MVSWLTSTPGECADVLQVGPDSLKALAPPARIELGSIGVNVHRFRSNGALDLAHEAGFRFVRADLLWERVERAGAYRFGAYDAMVNALEARGMGVLLILDYGHPDHGGKVPRTAQDRAAFGRFAEAAATHFKGHDARYEIWNEPDIAQFWPAKPDAREYGALLREATAAIHKADPGAKVVSGGMSRFDATFLRKAIDPGLGAELSAIGVHPYPRKDPEKIGTELERLRRWARQTFGERVEIWDTEWGYSSASAEGGGWGDGHSYEGRLRQARLAVRELLTVWSAGFPLAVWYDLQDDGADGRNPEQNYGLLDAGGAEKPVMQAVRTLMATVKGREYSGMAQHTPSGIYAMRFDRPSDVLFVVWSELNGKRRTIQYTRENLLSVTGLMGNSLEKKTDGAAGPRIEIDAESGPVYLVWKRK